LSITRIGVDAPVAGRGNGALRLAMHATLVRDDRSDAGYLPRSLTSSNQPRSDNSIQMSKSALQRVQLVGYAEVADFCRHQHFFPDANFYPAADFDRN
jgi:hypothetical protein